jgi:ADP-heptose:LPS heptosyltransferase
MNVDVMRWIDHWAGVPLCFLLTVVHRPFGLGEKAPSPKRILFIELSEMGSTILADPAMRKAQRQFDAELFFVIFRRNAASLAFLRTVPEDNVYTIREDSLFTLARDTLGFLRWSRRRQIDTVVDLELFSRFTALLTGLCGAARRVGFYRFHNEGLYRGELLTHRVAYNPHMHIAKNFVALINALASPVAEIPYSKTVVEDAEIALPRVAADPAAGAEMQERIKRAFAGYDPARHRIVLFNPNASELLPQRRWPPEHFAQLAESILANWEDVVILVTGAPEEEVEARALCARLGQSRMVNFAGRQQLRELPALYGLAELMVTNDSGPGHFASVTDMPTISLFGPETPALYGPLGDSQAITAGLACSPCVSAANHRKTACTDAVCMRAISPAQVLDAVRRRLDGGRRRAFVTGHS